MMGTVDLDELMRVCRYVILAKEDDGEILFCPLPLDGSETMDEAISHFKDCRCVLAENSRSRAGRYAISERFDGKPTPEDDAIAKRLSGD